METNSGSLHLYLYTSTVTTFQSPWFLDYQQFFIRITNILVTVIMVSIIQSDFISMEKICTSKILTNFFCYKESVLQQSNIILENEKNSVLFDMMFVIIIESFCCFYKKNSMSKQSNLSKPWIITYSFSNLSFFVKMLPSIPYFFYTLKNAKKLPLQRIFLWISQRICHFVPMILPFFIQCTGKRIFSMWKIAFWKKIY